MTLNLWNLAGPWRERRTEILAWLERLAPDVVCLQEVLDDGDRNQADWLAERSGYDGVFSAGVEARPGFRFGPAILAREAFATTASWPLPNEPGPTDAERLLVHGRTTDGLDVFATHLTSLYPSGALRENQCHAVADLVAAHADPSSPLPPILAGDFNAEPDSAEIRYLCGLQSRGGHSVFFQDAWRVAGGRGPGFTWDNRNPFAAAEHEPDRRIDYVFVGERRPGGAGRVESCRVVCDRAVTGTFASDHFGVLAEIAKA